MATDPIVRASFAAPGHRIARVSIVSVVIAGDAPVASVVMMQGVVILFLALLTALVDERVFVRGVEGIFGGFFNVLPRRREVIERRY